MCIHVCIYIHICKCNTIFLFIYVYRYICVFILEYIYVYINICIFMRIFFDLVPCLIVGKKGTICVCLCLRACVLCLFLCVCVCVYMCVFVCMKESENNWFIDIYIFDLHIPAKRGSTSSVGQNKWLLISRSSVQFRPKPKNRELKSIQIWAIHRPRIKGTKLLFQVIKAIRIIHTYIHTWI